MSVSDQPQLQKNDRKKAKFSKRMILKIFRLFFWSLVAKLRLRRGFYLPGIPEITAEKLYERLQSEDKDKFYLIDFRVDEDLEKDGYFENAVIYPFLSLPSVVDEIPKGKIIITMCPGGGASLVGAEVIIKSGFPKDYVLSLKGGVWNWKKKGFPLQEYTLDARSEKMHVEEKNIDALLAGKEVSSTEKISADFIVDARNMSCPQPLLESRKALKKNIEIGQTLEIRTTDPGSMRDIPSWAVNTNQEFLAYQKVNAEFKFYIKRTN